MRAMNIEGVSRQRRKVFTTRQDPAAVRAPDLVKRIFTATAPNELWVESPRVLCSQVVWLVAMMAGVFEARQLASRSRGGMWPISP